MKLYAKVTSERATKGQGGNERLRIDIMNEQHGMIAYLHIIPTDAKPVVGFFPDIRQSYVVTSHEEFTAIVEQLRKGKKQKGEVDAAEQKCIYNHDHAREPEKCMWRD
jgi:hypothetical protein